MVPWFKGPFFLAVVLIGLSIIVFGAWFDIVWPAVHSYQSYLIICLWEFLLFSLGTIFGAFVMLLFLKAKKHRKHCCAGNEVDFYRSLGFNHGIK
jgi:hypothetical protein